MRDESQNEKKGEAGTRMKKVQEDKKQDKFMEVQKIPIEFAVMMPATWMWNSQNQPNKRTPIMDSTMPGICSRSLRSELGAVPGLRWV